MILDLVTSKGLLSWVQENSTYLRSVTTGTFGRWMEVRSLFLQLYTIPEKLGPF